MFFDVTWELVTYSRISQFLNGQLVSARYLHLINRLINMLDKMSITISAAYSKLSQPEAMNSSVWWVAIEKHASFLISRSYTNLTEVVGQFYVGKIAVATVAVVVIFVFQFSYCMRTTSM